MYSISPSTVMSLSHFPLTVDRWPLSIYAMQPSSTSRRLCVGILVAIPTAIPLEPLMSRFGNLAGSTLGSSPSLS